MTTAEFGFTRWGAELVRLAEPMEARTPNRHAPRARSIARNGGVTLSIDGATVTASIHRGGEASTAHLEFTAAGQALRARIGEFRSSGADLVDAQYHDLLDSGLTPVCTLVAADCSCRARSTMCTHVLATLYALAAQVDRLPNTVVELLGLHQAPSSTEDSKDRATTAVDTEPPVWVSLAAVRVHGFFG